MSGAGSGVTVAVFDPLAGRRVALIPIADPTEYTVAKLQTHVLEVLIGSRVSSAPTGLAAQLTMVYKGAVLMPYAVVSSLKDVSKDSVVTVYVLIPAAIQSLRDSSDFFRAAPDNHHFFGSAASRFMIPTSPGIPAAGAPAPVAAGPAAPVPGPGPAAPPQVPPAGGVAGGIIGGQAGGAAPQPFPGAAQAPAAPAAAAAGPFNFANMIRVFMFAMVFGSTDTMIPMFCLMVLALAVHYVYRQLFPAFPANNQQPAAAGGANVPPAGPGAHANVVRNVVRKRYPGVLGFVSDVEWFLYGLFASINPSWEMPEVPADNDGRRAPPAPAAAVEVQQ